MKIGIIAKFEPDVIRHVKVLHSFLISQKIAIIYEANMKAHWIANNETWPDEIELSESAPSDLDCVIVLGGDGTFLHAVRWIGDQSLPIVGIKFGMVGFLSEILEENMLSMAHAIIQKEYTIEKRMRLNVRVMRGDLEITHQSVLNDVVINKGALARLANITTFIDTCYITTYRADGLIVSTPTGSTAYSLAAGGPIVHPEVAGILMTPICPFTLTNRPLILPDNVHIKIQLAKDATDIMLTFDGQEGMMITDNDIILIEKSSHPVHMIKIPGQTYFDVIKTKLRWSGGR